MNRPRTDDPNHRQLESEVAEFLAAAGFLLPPASTYHSIWPDDMVDLMQNRWSPTSLMLRGKADRVAVHAHLDVSFQWECKTSRGKRFSTEALPLSAHMAVTGLGTVCVYFCRHLKWDVDRAFVVSPESIAKFSCFMEPIGNRCTVPSKTIRGHLGMQVPIVPTESKGSKDPFVLMERNEYECLPLWSEIVDQFTGTSGLDGRSAEKAFRMP